MALQYLPFFLSPTHNFVTIRNMSTSFEKLHKSLLKFLLATSIEDMYKTIVQEVIFLVGLSYGSIYIRDEKQQMIRVFTTLPKNFEITPRKKGYMAEAFRTSSPLLIPVEEFIKVHKEYAGSNICAIILVPLSYKNEKLGILSINALEKTTLSEEEKKILQLFGAMASLAISNAQSFNNMQKALRLRDEFISLAAHELRTPLTSIHGYIQLLQKRLRNTHSQEKEWIDELYNQTFRLIYLVNEMLESTKISTKKQKYIMSSIHVEKVITNMITYYQALNKNREYIIQNNVGVDKDIVIGDAKKLEQLFSHILDNAEKFSQNNGKIIITLNKHRQNIVIEVTNSGDTFTNQEASQLFERFYKGKNNTKTGMGLGLYLAKQIARVHKGKVELQSKKGTATAKIILPLQK